MALPKATSGSHQKNETLLIHRKIVAKRLFMRCLRQIMEEYGCTMNALCLGAFDLWASVERFEVQCANACGVLKDTEKEGVICAMTN